MPIGPVVFNYTVTDGTTPVSGVANLTVTPVNDAPVATPVTLAARTRTRNDSSPPQSCLPE